MSTVDDLEHAYLAGALGLSGESLTINDLRYLYFAAGVGGTLPVAAATTTAVGGVKKMPVQADSVAVDVPGLVTDFNALLAKLRTAGILS